MGQAMNPRSAANQKWSEVSMSNQAEHKPSDSSALATLMDRLVQLMAKLRSPDGCPWDRAQDYDSMRALLLEEAYEAIDAVNERDFDELEVELGDLLFQVVFYSRLAEEEG